ncbi:hypothetical protein F4778DRAFT_719242 [Xylariomycetidae sp. FL2044]|nr:hypothetical protein F4778DRAFT_719242 [Xylariomycetidae sp. FL2044]
MPFFTRKSSNSPPLLPRHNGDTVTAGRPSSTPSSSSPSPTSSSGPSSPFPSPSSSSSPSSSGSEAEQQLLAYPKPDPMTYDPEKGRAAAPPALLHGQSKRIFSTLILPPEARRRRWGGLAAGFGFGGWGASAGAGAARFLSITRWMPFPRRMAWRAIVCLVLAVVVVLAIWSLVLVRRSSEAYVEGLVAARLPWYVEKEIL